VIARHSKAPPFRTMLVAVALLLGTAGAVGFSAPADASTYPCAPGQTLKYGQWSSSCVNGLQTYLNGFQNAKLGVDGDFGWATHNAVRIYQSRHGLTTDGVVGPQTRDYMCSYLGTGIPVNSGATFNQRDAAGLAIHYMCLGWGYHYN